MKRIFLFFLVGGLVFSCGQDVPIAAGISPAAAAAPDEASKESVKGVHLAEPDQVRQWMEEGADLIIIEISKEEKFAEGHLPGAFRVWRPDYEAQEGYEYTGMRASKEDMEALLRSFGTTADSKIVLYDTKGNVDAVRLMWILDSYGHDNMVVMNGAKKAWSDAGYPLSTEPTALPAPSGFRFTGRHRQQRLATIEEVMAALDDPNVVLLDTREPEEYQGVPYLDKGRIHPWKDGAFTFGRIPGSVHLNWSDAVDLEGDHRFKSLKALRYNFTQAGVTPDKTIIAYCQSGVRSSHTTYVLTELLGYPNVKNYDGSWIEWSYHYVTQGDVEIERDFDEARHAQLVEELAAKTATAK